MRARRRCAAESHLRKPFVFLPSRLRRHGRFKRSNSVTAAVQADLELEGFPGRVTMEDKGLQFGPTFQRHSEPSTPTQYGAVRTVRTQGVFSYREDYRAPVDTATLPPPEPWLEPCVETADTGRMSPCRRDGSWFVKLLHTETKRMEGWCKDMEREAEENDLSEESKNTAPSGFLTPSLGSSMNGQVPVLMRECPLILGQIATASHSIPREQTRERTEKQPVTCSRGSSWLLLDCEPGGADCGVVSILNLVFHVLALSTWSTLSVC